MPQKKKLLIPIPWLVVPDPGFVFPDPTLLIPVPTYLVTTLPSPSVHYSNALPLSYGETRVLQ